MQSESYPHIIKKTNNLSAAVSTYYKKDLQFVSSYARLDALTGGYPDSLHTTDHNDPCQVVVVHERCYHRGELRQKTLLPNSFGKLLVNF